MLSIFRSTIFVALLLSVSACSEVKLAYLQDKVRAECTGNNTVRCFNLRTDLMIFQSKFHLEHINNHKSDYVSLIGDEGYINLKELVEARINFLDDDRPNFFYRWFLSDMEWEGDSTDTYSPKIEEILRQMDRIEQERSQSSQPKVEDLSDRDITTLDEDTTSQEVNDISDDAQVDINQER